MMKQNHMVNTLIFYPYLDYNATYLIDSDQLCMPQYAIENCAIDLCYMLHQWNINKCDQYLFYHIQGPLLQV